jgi:hypothetical protein
MSARDDCPACGASLPVTARYCSQCGAELADPGLAGDASGGAGAEAGAGAGTGTGGRWPLDPDGVADDSLTLLVAAGVAAVVGVVNGVTALLTVYEGWALLVAPVAMVVVAGYLARRRTAGVALAHGLYALAATVALVPLVAFSPGWEGGDPGGTLVLFGLGGLLFGAAAVLLAGAGVLVERRSGDDDTAPGRALDRLRGALDARRSRERP